MISIRNKWLAILGGLMILLVVDVGYSHAWIYYVTPAFKGRITDATTGAPIENAIIEVSWIKGLPGLGSPGSGHIADELVVTDKNGKYHIPSKLSWHFFSWFDCVHFTVRHPLYETRKLLWIAGEINRLKNGEQQHKAEILGEIDYAKVEYQNGVIIYDIQPLSLAERYKERAFLKGGSGSLGYEIRVESSMNYFRLAKKLGLSVDYNAVFQKWDEIIKPFEGIKVVTDDVESAKNRIRDTYKEDKSEK